MLYNYYFIIVLILLLPVTLNIILPLIMLAVWLLKQLVSTTGDANPGTQVLKGRREESNQPQPGATASGTRFPDTSK